MLADFAYLRGLVLLRRIAVALERLIELEDEKVHPLHRAPRLHDLSIADTATLNAAYRKANPRYDGTDDLGPEEP